MILRPGEETVLIISDTQSPFHHRDTLPFLDWVASKYSPTQVVHVGDEADFHSLSRYTKDPNGKSAGDELKMLVQSLKPFYEMFPKVKVCVSNHTNRPFDRAFEIGLPREFMKSIKEVLHAPDGWEWSEKWIIDEIAYVHGHTLPGGTNALQQVAKNYGRSVVFGHVHAHAGIYYLANDEQLKFAFNVGCLIDVHAYAFEYGKRYIHKPIIGCGVVRKGIPIFMPMLLGTDGRWIYSKTQVQVPANICSHSKLYRRGKYTTKDGVVKQVLRCRDCGKKAS